MPSETHLQRLHGELVYGIGAWARTEGVTVPEGGLDRLVTRMLAFVLAERSQVAEEVGAAIEKKPAGKSSEEIESELLLSLYASREVSRRWLGLNMVVRLYPGEKWEIVKLLAEDIAQWLEGAKP